MIKKIDDIEDTFNDALSRYQAGENLQTLIKDFEQITTQLPNHFAAWTCLSWLHLLLKNNEEGLFAARQAVRLNNQDPQARMNLSLALLATNNKGVRDHITVIKRLILIAPDIQEDLKSSMDDGLSKYPEWPEMKKIKNWLEF